MIIHPARTLLTPGEDFVLLVDVSRVEVEPNVNQEIDIDAELKPPQRQERAHVHIEAHSQRHEDAHPEEQQHLHDVPRLAEAAVGEIDRACARVRRASVLRITTRERHHMSSRRVRFGPKKLWPQKQASNGAPLGSLEDVV